MNRRELLLFGGVMAASGPVCAQQKPMPRIGLLYPNSLEQWGARACTARGFWDTELKPTPPEHAVEGAAGDIQPG